MKLSTFFQTEYVDYASYDNLRKIGSIMDGQKNAARKILYTTLEKNIKEEIKVSQLGSKVAEFSEYLHGNLDNVIVNLAQDYIGTNNLPLMVPEGNFGTRFAQEASAARYIFTHGSKAFFELFNDEDNPILVHQSFEGQKIEPRFYVPELPVLLINGSEGVSSGFAQKILPRNPEKIKLAVKAVVQGTTLNYDWLIPWYRGFNGTIERGETTEQWIIKGVAKKTAANKIVIEELPLNYDLRGYLDVLDDLEDKKIIQSYTDQSENDTFRFAVTVPAKVLSTWSEEDILVKLKLVKKISENYTVMDENNRIRVFDTVYDVLRHYVQVKLDFMGKRKAYKLQRLENEISLEESRWWFVSAIVQDELKINKRSKAAIEVDLELMDGIIKHEDSFDYLLNMNIGSLTQERLDRLKKSIDAKREERDKTRGTSIEDMWLAAI